MKEVLLNGDSYTSRFTSLLASPDRDYLLSPTGTQIKVSNLNGNVVGLYFSANWYPPCRNFNQILVRIYEELKVNGSNFEVVYVSSDEDSDAFTDYHSTMPWPAVPFSDLESKKALNKKFEIEGIPCLILMQPYDNKDEEATLRDGVELVYRYGVEAFPFTKERLEQLKKEDREKEDNQTLINLLTNHNRDYLLGHPRPKQVPISSLVGKTIGLYFSAQWCLPGVFMPRLISEYEKIKQMIDVKEEEVDEGFEIVFVSSDRDQDSFDSYFDSMPWLALPFGDQVIKNLAKHFDIQGIPCLIILGPNGKTVTKNGRNLINLYLENAYPFTEARVEALEKKMDEEAKKLPISVWHGGHRHELNLVSEGTGGGPFICCECDEQGSGWAYQCLLCGFEVHPKCVKTRTEDSAVDGR